METDVISSLLATFLLQGMLGRAAMPLAKTKTVAVENFMVKRD